MKFLDRTRILERWRCPQARFWGYEYRGWGIEPVEPNADLAFGSLIHEQLALIKTSQPWSLPDTLDPETALLARGLLIAYSQRIWPEWMTCYDVVSVEEECELPLAPEVTYLSRHDAIIRDRTGALFYLEHKTTGSRDTRWMKQWEYSVQLHVSAYVAEQHLGIQLAGVIVQGLYKGYKRDGIVYSPLVRQWRKPGMPGLTSEQWSPERRAGWELVPLTEHPLGQEGAIKALSDDLLHQQFPTTPPIPVNRSLARTFLDEALDEETRGWAPTRHFTECDPGFRPPCPFLSCCFIPWVGHDPVASGLYRWRTPNHPQEHRDAASD